MIRHPKNAKGSDLRKLILLALMAPFFATAQVTWLEGKDCRITWQKGAGGGPVEGYRVYLSANNPVTESSIDVGTTKETTCAALGAVQGVNRVWATAYNPVGESAPSSAIRFRLFTQETLQAPAAPLNLILEVPQ